MAAVDSNRSTISSYTVRNVRMNRRQLREGNQIEKEETIINGHEQWSRTERTAELLVFMLSLCPFWDYAGPR